MYSEVLRQEILDRIQHLCTLMQKGTFVSIETIRDEVAQGEILVPELKEYNVKLDKEFWAARIIPFVQQSLKLFDPSPAEKTRIIKKYVSKEKIDIYSSILEGSIEEIKDFITTLSPDAISKFKEAIKNSDSYDELQLKLKHSIIKKAIDLCLKNGNLTLSEAIRMCLKNNNQYSDEDNESASKLMTYVNELFAWICEHEMDLVKEFVFYKKREEIIEKTIEENYPDYELPENPNMEDIFFALLMEASNGVSDLKYTKAFDEYLDSQVKELVDLLVEQ